MRQDSYRGVLYYVGYGLLVALAYFIEFTPFMIGFFGAYPSPLLILVIITAMFENDLCAAVVGLCAGVLTDINVINGSGLHALCYMLIALCISLLVEILLQNNILSLLYVGAVAILFQSVVELLTKSRLTDGFIPFYFQTYFHSALCSFVMLIPVYLLFALVFNHHLRFKPPESIVPRKLRIKQPAVRKKGY